MVFCEAKRIVQQLVEGFFHPAAEEGRRFLQLCRAANHHPSRDDSSHAERTPCMFSILDIYSEHIRMTDAATGRSLEVATMIHSIKGIGER